MAVVIVVVAIAAAWFGGALAEYISGRILLPEMGLRAPGYWTWFWFTLVWLIAGAVFSKARD